MNKTGGIESLEFYFQYGVASKIYKANRNICLNQTTLIFVFIVIVVFFFLCFQANIGDWIFQGQINVLKAFFVLLEFVI